jgi:hypothetical protein
MGFYLNPNPPTLRQDARKAKVILYGYPAKSQKPTWDGINPSTEFHILRTLKKDPILGKRKSISLPVYISIPNPKKPPKFIVFAKVAKGKLVPFRGFDVPSEKSVDYLRRAMTLDSKDTPKALEYFFRHLDYPDPDVSADAFLEFRYAEYKDLRVAAKKFSADKILKWLQDPKTPERRYGVYGMLLGHCGTEKHAGELGKMLRDAKYQDSFSFDGLLIGYTMLQPEKGWAYVRGIVSKPKRSFLVAYQSLKAVRFFGDNRPDLVKRKDLVDGLCLFLKHIDVCDFAIDDLRRWKRWETADKVLALTISKAHNLPVIHRAILKFALSWPTKDAKAKAFIAEERKKNKEEVEEIEQALKEEAEDKSKR